MKPPFKMIVETDMEKYRHDTFWTKEPETLAWIQSFTDGDIFFDVGANIGIYSLYCAAIHPKCQIYAFEAFHLNYWRLRENIDKNLFTNQITPLCLIISNVSRKMDFIEKSNEIGSSGGQMQKGSSLFSYTIDLLPKRLDFPTYIKIDIDGQELKVIHGMKKTFTDERLKSVLVEVHPQDKDEIMDIMDRAGFVYDYRFNCLTPHSRERRAIEGIPEENIIFSRKRGLNG